MRQSLLCLLLPLALSTSLMASGRIIKPLPTKISAAETMYEQRPWSLDYTFTRTQQAILNHIVRFDYGRFTESKLHSLAIAYLLPRTNRLRCFFYPIVPTVAVALNLTYQKDEQRHIYELNPYLLFRWVNFPWSERLPTSIAVGEGLSYATGIPLQETIDSNRPGNTRHLLNYLLFELTLSLPKHQELQLIYRIHHRSGAFGTFSPGLTGSTSVGGGIRYFF